MKKRLLKLLNAIVDSKYLIACETAFFDNIEKYGDPEQYKKDHPVKIKE
jgi:hypothetical protein